MIDRTVEQKLTSRGLYIPGYKGAVARAVAGFQRLGDQEPYFHVLCQVDHKLGNNRWESSYPSRWGMCADLETFKEHFKEIAVLATYHLWSKKSGPMHYASNANYFLGQYRVRAHSFIERFHTLESFKRAIAWGLLTDDHPRKLDDVIDSTEEIYAFLANRLPKLLAKFESDVKHLLPGIWERSEEL